MDLTIQQGDLAFAVGRALGSVQQKSTQPLLSCVLLEADAKGLRVTGTDLDDNALVAAAENATRNGVSIALFHPQQRIGGAFDIVIANILTNPLCVLAPLLSGLVRRGGRLVLSGILDSQAAQVRAAYLPAVSLEVAATRDGWVLLEGACPR